MLRLRWYVVAVVMALTALGGWHVKHAQPLYLGTSIVVLTPPTEQTVPNRLAAVSSSLAVTGLAVNTALLDTSQAARLAQAGVIGDYTITPRNSGTSETPQYQLPSELLSVQAGDPNVALHSVTVLQTLYAEQLDEWQADQGLDPAIRITAQVLVPPDVQGVLGSHSRALIGTALLGAGTAISVPLWFDQYARRRERRGKPFKLRLRRSV